MGENLILAGSYVMRNFSRSLSFHLLLLCLVSFAMYIIFFFYLHYITRHGEVMELPNITGKPASEAVSALEDMHFTVFTDSVYEPSLKPLLVLKQTPAAGSVVKEGRAVIVTVNMLTPPNISMPDLEGLSFKSAEMLLRTNKLFIEDTVYKPYVKSGVILRQIYRGYPIKPGELVAQGSKITLEIGDGMGNTEHFMPDVTNINCEMAMAILYQLNLQITVVPKDATTRIPDTLTARIVDQDPKPGAQIKDGDKITLVAE